MPGVQRFRIAKLYCDVHNVFALANILAACSNLEFMTRATVKKTSGGKCWCS
jgi:hypothetical protein